MNRERVKAVVVKHIRANIDGLGDAAIDTRQSMAELGATSLDIVEIVATAMRELEVRVPRAKLLGLRNIDELVDLLASHDEKGA